MRCEPLHVWSDDAEVVVIRWAGSGGGSISYHGLSGHAGKISIVKFHPHYYYFPV
jgi:hypothetical protein